MLIQDKQSDTKTDGTIFRGGAYPRNCCQLGGPVLSIGRAKHNYMYWQTPPHKFHWLSGKSKDFIENILGIEKEVTGEVFEEVFRELRTPSQFKHLLGQVKLNESLVLKYFVRFFLMIILLVNLIINLVVIIFLYSKVHRDTRIKWLGNFFRI